MIPSTIFQVERTTQSVTDIKKTTRNNRQEYKLLSLLSMPKMRNLHLHLQNELSLKNIIEDVGLIMECDDFCRYSQVDFLHSKLQVFQLYSFLIIGHSHLIFRSIRTMKNALQAKQ